MFSIYLRRFITSEYTPPSMAKKGNSKDSKAPHSIQNRRARYDYAIQETYEAGISLVGSEVKSIYLGKAHLTDAYCRVVNGEMWLINMDIEPYEQASVFAHERRRDRKLLLHRREISVLERKTLEKGLTLVPLAAYFKNGRVKIEIGLGRGKAAYDKRDKVAKDDARREIERGLSGRD
jgi:SsrA-binding protein